MPIASATSVRTSVAETPWVVAVSRTTPTLICLTAPGVVSRVSTTVSTPLVRELEELL